MKLIGLCGSLRAASYNRALLRAAQGMLPEGVTLEIAEIGDLPIYDQDLFDRGMPPAVQRMRAQVAAADGLYIASPENNFSIPAVLKNAIDWGSRAPDQVFADKPAAIVSASPGMLGGARMQYDLRKVLGAVGALVMPQPEVFVGAATGKFGPDHELADETTARHLRKQLAAFVAWVERVRPRA